MNTGYNKDNNDSKFVTLKNSPNMPALWQSLDRGISWETDDYILVLQYCPCSEVFMKNHTDTGGQRFDSFINPPRESIRYYWVLFCYFKSEKGTSQKEDYIWPTTIMSLEQERSLSLTDSTGVVWEEPIIFQYVEGGKRIKIATLRNLLEMNTVVLDSLAPREKDHLEIRIINYMVNSICSYLSIKDSPRELGDMYSACIALYRDREYTDSSKSLSGTASLASIKTDPGLTSFEKVALPILFVGMFITAPIDALLPCLYDIIIKVRKYPFHFHYHWWNRRNIKRRLSLGLHFLVSLSFIIMILYAIINHYFPSFFSTARYNSLFGNESKLSSTVIDESVRGTGSKRELDEQERVELNLKLLVIESHLTEKPVVEIEYFIPDIGKAGGEYVFKSGAVVKIQPGDKQIILSDGTVIPVEDIVSISCELFSGGI